MTIPKSIGHMDDVSIREVDRDIRVSVRRRIVLQCQCCSVEMQSLFGVEYFCWQSSGRRWREVEIPILNSRGNGKMFSRVLVRSDFSAYRMQPFIAIGVIEVPMGI